MGGNNVRKLSLILSFFVTVSLGGAALMYLEQRVGQNRIQVQDEWLSSTDQRAYHSYGQVVSIDADTVQLAPPRRDSLPRN